LGRELLDGWWCTYGSRRGSSSRLERRRRRTRCDHALLGRKFLAECSTLLRQKLLERWSGLLFLGSGCGSSLGDEKGVFGWCRLDRGGRRRGSGRCRLGRKLLERWGRWLFPGSGYSSRLGSEKWFFGSGRRGERGRGVNLFSFERRQSSQVPNLQKKGDKCLYRADTFEGSHVEELFNQILSQAYLLLVMGWRSQVGKGRIRDEPPSGPPATGKKMVGGV
jgi:hypothetical protein